ncbi:hypothetical protein ACFQ21_25770 [Ohtaekwangia kribbensis]|jgi:hypothetical protein|uniref:Uncharacterized protein n=1 Tax=Ohtaekwangia kribbensis TaxID=688913 RepID=A0ABW3K8Y6_9BACT
METTAFLESKVEVLGRFIVTFINAIPLGKEYCFHILRKYGIENIETGNWYGQRQCLKAIEEICNALGPNMILSIGKSISGQAVFSPRVDSLEKALRAIDVVYGMNHRGDGIGGYDLITFDPEGRFAEMVCSTPYPSDFDRGIILTTLSRFKPKDSSCNNVWLNLSKPTRLHGSKSCTYLIKW